MKKFLYMTCIMTLSVLLGITICKTQHSVLYAIPIGALTGFLFSLFEAECSKNK